MKKRNICSLTNEKCKTPYQCSSCQIRVTESLGFETLKEPTEDGVYLCRCQFYKDKNNVVEEEIEYLGEWKITDTWNLLGWKAINKDEPKAIFRKFQVRDFGDGTYSVIFNLDLPKGTEVYEKDDLINLSYDEAVKKAREMEEEYAAGKLNVDVSDKTKWTLVYID